MRRMLIGLLLLLPSALLAQDSLEVSLQQAIDLALTNSTKAKSAQIDIDEADKEMWVQIAKGLPQVNGAISFTNFIQLPTSLIDATAFGAPAGSPPQELQFGEKYNMDAGITAGLQLFDGSYLIGLKGAKGFQKLTRDKSKLTRVEIASSIADAYYTVLVAQQNTGLLKASVSNMEKTLTETSALFENGFAEEMDVEQLQLLVNNMNSRISAAERQVNATRNLLKYQMGTDLDTRIVLTDDLKSLWAMQDPESLLVNEFNPQNNISYNLIQQDIVLHGYLIKMKESKYYPRLTAYFDYKQQAFREKFDFYDFGRSWYPQTLWGIKLSVPIWDNLGGLASINKAKLEQQRVKNSLYDAEQGLKLKYRTARDNFISASEQLKNEKNSMDLATRIRDKVLFKYREGLGSSMELTTSENQLISSQTNYINALFKVMDARTELTRTLEINP